MSDQVHICSFSTIDALPRRQWRDKRAVLEVLAETKRFSSFEVSEHPTLWGAVKALERDGLIQFVDQPFPWHGVALTDKGAAYLGGSA